MTDAETLPLRRKLALAGEIVTAYVRARWLLRRHDLPHVLRQLRGSPRGHPPTAAVSDERLARAVRRMPNPRLTDLGCGVFCGVSMFALACLDRLLFGASPVLYGVLFLLVSALTAVWVRGGDLASAPVVVPIAFAFGLPLLAEGEGGLAGHLMALVTALATQAGWLYGGTLVAGVIVLTRRVRLVRRRAAARARATA